MRKKLLAILLAAVMVMALFPTAFAADTSGTIGENITWSLDGGVLTVSGTGEIPAEAFRSSHDITSVVIEDGVTGIGSYAFFNCDNLTGVTIPASVTGIGNFAFDDCDSLASVTIPYGVTSIGDNAFSWCPSLTGVTIPDSVTSIGESAFYDCESLTSVAIPASVASIGDYAFNGCYSLTGISVASGNPAYCSVDGALFSLDKTVLYQYPAAKSGPYEIPASVTYLAYGAFEGASLTSVTIPGSVEIIGPQMFDGCDSLTSVIMLNGITNIGPSAFNCPNLTSVTIPASVTHMSWEAFYCDNLTDVYYGGSESQWGEIVSVGWGVDPTFAEGGQDQVGLHGVNVHYNSIIPEPTEPETPAITFDDVDPEEWYAAAVSWGVGKGYVLGHGDGTFAPEETCTHIQILTFLWRAAGWDETAPQAPVEMDPNVPQYQFAANWAYDKGMIDGTFDPDADCTRADAVTYIWQAFGKEDAPAGGFTDVDAGADYAKAVDWAAANGITVGDDAVLNTFNPGKVCDRGEIVTFLHRAYVPEVRVHA